MKRRAGDLLVVGGKKTGLKPFFVGTVNTGSTW